MEKTILVVDDSPTVVKFVSFSLKSKGFHIVTACDGMDAIEKMSSMHGDIDLVITDLNMPNLDGYGLIDTLRQNQKYKDTPIIILTSEDDDKDMEKGIDVGANSYLVKPFKSNILIEEVSKYLS
jgi:two-component system chemotaxis response regulator CheY